MTIRETSWPSGTPCWVDLAVPDVPAATMFYRVVLGWSFVDTGPEFNHYTVCRTFRRAAAAIGPGAAPDQPAAWTIYLASDDADATAKLIVENGGSLLVEPTDIGDNGRMCVAIDASGGVFGVWQAIETIGLEITDEPGSLVWTDARLTDPVAGKDFYAAVFGYRYQPVAGAPADYGTFLVDGRVAGGHGRDAGRGRGAGALAGLLLGGRRRRHGRRRADRRRHGRRRPAGHPVRPHRAAGRPVRRDLRPARSPAHPADATGHDRRHLPVLRG